MQKSFNITTVELWKTIQWHEKISFKPVRVYFYDKNLLSLKCKDRCGGNFN